jgi:hypothetical protein
MIQYRLRMGRAEIRESMKTDEPKMKRTSTQKQLLDCLTKNYGDSILLSITIEIEDHSCQFELL